MVRNQDIQDKLRAEIDAAYEEADGEMPDYNVIQVKFDWSSLNLEIEFQVYFQNLPYLDMVVHEALRLHPPAGTFDAMLLIK